MTAARLLLLLLASSTSPSAAPCLAGALLHLLTRRPLGLCTAESSALALALGLRLALPAVSSSLPTTATAAGPGSLTLRLSAGCISALRCTATGLLSGLRSALPAPPFTSRMLTVAGRALRCSRRIAGRSRGASARSATTLLA